MITLDQVDWAMISPQELDMMLRFCEQVNAELSNQLTPLCTACKYNREDLVTVLLHHGALANRPCSFYNKRPLHFACDHSSGNLGIVRQLLRANANVDACDHDGNTGLHLACTESNMEVVELLIDAGADVNLEDIDGETPLVRACFAKSFDLINILLKTGSDPNSNRGSPLAIAVMNSSFDSLKLLLDAGANIDQGACLSHACEHSQLEVVELLLSYGVDVNKCDTLGLTPLHTACLSFQATPACVQLLLERGAEPNMTTSMGKTALHCAAITHNVDKIRLLLAYGADVNESSAQFLSSMVTCFADINNKDKCYQILSIFLAAGIKVGADTWLSLNNFTFSSCCSRHRSDLMALMNRHQTQPLSLQSVCRIVIRGSVKSNVEESLKTLPLPQHVIRFLNFHNIGPEPMN